MKVYLLVAGLVIAVAAVSLFTAGTTRRCIHCAQFRMYCAALLLRDKQGAGWSEEEGSLREYLKARYYYLSTKVPDHVVVIEGIDFGPVDSDIVKGLPSAESGPSTPAEDYAAFMHKKDGRH